jgi:hypothetical protein
MDAWDARNLKVGDDVRWTQPDRVRTGVVVRLYAQFLTVLWAGDAAPTPYLFDTDVRFLERDTTSGG